MCALAEIIMCDASTPRAARPEISPNSTSRSTTTPLPITGTQLRVQDARRQQVQRVPLAVDHDGVTGVVAPGVADAVVDPIAELVGCLALALVAPLGAYHHNARHLIAVLPVSHVARRKRVQAPGRIRRRDSCDLTLPNFVRSVACADRPAPRFGAVSSAYAVSDESRRNWAQRSSSTVSPIRSGGERQGVQRAQEAAVRLVLPGDRAGPASSPPGAARPGRGGSRSGRTRTRRRRPPGCRPAAPLGQQGPAQARGGVCADDLDEALRAAARPARPPPGRPAAGSGGGPDASRFWWVCSVTGSP